MLLGCLVQLLYLKDGASEDPEMSVLSNSSSKQNRFLDKRMVKIINNFMYVSVVVYFTNFESLIVETCA